MIPYHGIPITPETALLRVARGGHCFVSHRYRQGLGAVIEYCQSFALDNSAFSAWKSGDAVQDWSEFYEWAAELMRVPSCDFAVIPDVIDGTEAENDRLVRNWPLPKWFGAPVWHMHESLTRLLRLAQEFPRVCIGSSGEFATIGTADWWRRIASVMAAVCDDDGRPKCRMHGLRMLNPEVFTRLPFASADSTNIGQNVGIDQAWRGTYPPASKDSRAQVMRERIEAFNAPARWGFIVPDVELATQGVLL